MANLRLHFSSAMNTPEVHRRQVLSRRAELNRRTMPRIRDHLRPRNSVVILCYANYFARLSQLEHQELVLTLGEDARQKVLRKTRQLRIDVDRALPNPRPP